MNRGEVWLVDFSPAVGQEMRKQRRAVIINPDNVGVLDLKVVIPFTEWAPERPPHPWMVRLNPNKENGVSKEVIADVFQIKSVSTKRLLTKLGVLSEKEIGELLETLRFVVGDIGVGMGQGFAKR